MSELGFKFDAQNKSIEFLDGGRTAMSTDGTLINLLPASNDYVATRTITFPDFSKNEVYMHQYFLNQHLELIDGALEDVTDKGSRCVAWVSAPPQEWSDTVDLVNAPSGANFVALLVKMERTTDPTHQWAGETVAPLVREGNYIPFSGSALLEAVTGMARAVSIYIKNGKLVIEQEQSVSVAPGGFGSRQSNDGSLYVGSDWYSTGAKGIPVYSGTSSPNRRNDAVGVLGTTFNYLRTCDKNGLKACSINDPTNYKSKWRLDIIAKFGRHAT